MTCFITCLKIPLQTIVACDALRQTHPTFIAQRNDAAHGHHVLMADESIEDKWKDLSDKKALLGKCQRRLSAISLDKLFLLIKIGGNWCIFQSENLCGNDRSDLKPFRCCQMECISLTQQILWKQCRNSTVQLSPCRSDALFDSLTNGDRIFRQVCHKIPFLHHTVVHW